MNIMCFFCKLNSAAVSLLVYFIPDKLIINAARRIGHKRLNRKVTITSAKQVAGELQISYGTLNREAFAVTYLDSKNQVLAHQVESTGSLNSAAIYPRDIVHAALEHGAAALILSHNHPSGDVEPSDADISITRKLKKTLDIFDIDILDHVIVSDKAWSSMSSMGLI